MAARDTVPKTYKGKPTALMTGPEYSQMLKDLGMDTPSKNQRKTPFNEEPDMGSSPAPKKKTAMAKGGMSSKFKPCASCPSPAKCKAAGKCLAKKAAKGMLVIPVKVSTKKMPAKAKAKK